MEGSYCEDIYQNDKSITRNYKQNEKYFNRKKFLEPSTTAYFCPVLIRDRHEPPWTVVASQTIVVIPSRIVKCLQSSSKFRVKTPENKSCLIFCVVCHDRNWAWEERHGACVHLQTACWDPKQRIQNLYKRTQVLYNVYKTSIQLADMGLFRQLPAMKLNEQHHQVPYTVPSMIVVILV